MHPMSLFDYKYRDDADESTGVDPGANAGAVSDDPTEPAALIETALTDPTDGSSDTATSGYPGDGEQRGVVFHLFTLFVELFVPTDWGDALRLVNFRWDESRLTLDREGQWRLLLYNRSTGMWRMQGNPGFQPLFDLMLSEANEEALEVAETDPAISDQVRGRLRRHIETWGGGSVSKALKRCTRLADDPCVPIHRVDPSSVNRVERYPVILCEDNTVSLTDGVVVDRADLQRHFLLDMAPAPTAFVGDATDSEAPGAVMMKRFLRRLGNGDETILCRRLGWQLCGHHETIDVIAGDYHAMSLLARALRDTLGPSGARVLSMGRGAVTTRHIADTMEQARLCLWMGADTVRQLPVWDLHSLISDIDSHRQGNLLLLVTDWPSNWDSLDHRIADKCGWAWRVQGNLADQAIDPEVMLNQDGREFLLAKLVEGATHGYRQFQDTKDETGIGDPGQVAADEYTQACAEEMQISGADPQHRTLYRAVRFTDDARDVMTLADINDAITSMGEDPILHHVVGKVIRRMWTGVEADRGRIEGTQKRVIRRIAPRVHHSDLPESFD